MKTFGVSITMAITLAASAGTAQALPPPLPGTASVTSNVAAGAVARPEEGSNRMLYINAPGGGQHDGGPGSRNIRIDCDGAFLGCGGSASSDSGFLPAPYVEATAGSRVSGVVPDAVVVDPTKGVGGFASTQAEYQFAVLGPAGTTAFVNLVSFMSVAFPGTNSLNFSAGVGAGFSIFGQGESWVETNLTMGSNIVGRLYRQTRDLQGNSVVTNQLPPGNGQFAESDIVPFAANTLYTVRVFANAQAITRVVNGPNNDGGSADAFADPTFSIDPMTPNAAAYSIVFSPGVGNTAPVPEPQTWALFACGLLAVGWLRIVCDRSKRPHAAVYASV